MYDLRYIIRRLWECPVDVQYEQGCRSDPHVNDFLAYATLYCRPS